MATESQRPKVPDGVLSSLNMAIGALNRAEATDTTPAKAALTSASALLTMIRVRPLPTHVCRLLANVYRTQ